MVDRTVCSSTPRTLKATSGTAKDWNNETRAITRAIGDAVIILTSGSKRFRLDGIEVLAVLKDRFVLCCLKDVERCIT